MKMDINKCKMAEIREKNYYFINEQNFSIEIPSSDYKLYTGGNCLIFVLQCLIHIRDALALFPSNTIIRKMTVTLLYVLQITLTKSYIFRGRTAT